MSKSKPGTYMTVDMSTLSKSAKKKAPSTSLFGVNLETPHPAFQSGDGSAMKKPGKETPEKRFDAAIERGLKMAQQSLVRKLVQGVLRDRIRSELNAKFGGRLSPEDIEKQANTAAQQVAYELQDMTELPESVQHSLTSTKSVEHTPYVADIEEVADNEEAD